MRVEGFAFCSGRFWISIVIDLFVSCYPLVALYRKTWDGRFPFYRRIVEAGDVQSNPHSRFNLGYVTGPTRIHKSQIQPDGILFSESAALCEETGF